MTSNKVLMFGLNHTTDVDQAERLADQLSREMTKATPRVRFSPAWVLRHTKSSVEVAQFAVRYCDDPDTLDKVARRETRQAVLRTLAANKALREDTYEVLLARASYSAQHAIRQTHARIIETANYVPVSIEDQFEEFIADETNFTKINHRYGKDIVVRHLQNFVDEIEGAGERFLVTSARLGKSDIFANFLASHYMIAGGSPTLWTGTALRPEQAVALLNDPERKALLTTFTNGMDDWRAAEEAPPIDFQMIEMVVAHVDPEDVYLRVRNDDRSARFTPEAIELLVDTPEWFKLLELCPLSDDQFARILATRPGLSAPDMFDLLQGSRHRLEMLLDELDDGLCITSDSASIAFGVLTDPLDPLVEKVIALGDDHTRICYLSGDFRIEDTTLLCEPKDVARHVAALSVGTTGTEALSQRVNGDLGDYSLEYLAALLEHIPGLANYAVLSDARSSEYVYDRLVATGADLSVCLDQLDRADKVTLFKLCSTLAILAKQS
jgi:hypothetical protein